MKKRASNISFIQSSFLILYQTGFLLSQSSATDFNMLRVGNLFNLTTKIMFDISPSPLERAGVRLIIYNILGREVATLVNEALKPGTYEVDWDGSGFASGVYFYQLITDEFTQTNKMVLTK